ncbi:MAG: class I SAM-dependent methyltransferase [bacterium]|nr:class I SAM-dependent methyltransferase [bacterium]
MYQSAIYAFLKFDQGFFPRIVKVLTPQKEDRILEIGCSRGILVKKMQATTPGTYGIDINAKAILNGVARNLKVMDASALEFPDASFDKIYSRHTIEHIPNLKSAFHEMARVLKKGGRIFLAYPAEPIRGLLAIPAALVLFKNPRSIHLHKLSPKRIVEEFIPGTGLKHIQSKPSFFSSPQYFTLLEKE